MNKSKYLNKVYNKIWKVENTITRKQADTSKRRNIFYVLVNMYNNRRVILNSTQIKKLDEGKTEISKIIHNKLKALNQHRDITF